MHSRSFFIRKKFWVADPDPHFKVKSRIRIRITVKRKIRIRLKEMWIRNSVKISVFQLISFNAYWS